MPNYKTLSLGELQRLVPQDHEAYYWLGMAYWEQGDYRNAIEWLERTMNDPGNEWATKAKNNVALAHEGGQHPNADKDEAIRLYEQLDGYAMPKLHLGFLYFKGTPRHHDPEKGKRLVKEAIEQLKKQNNGSDEYLSQFECFTIGMMLTSVEYYKKAIQRCDLSYSSDQRLKAIAEDEIRKLGG